MKHNNEVNGVVMVTYDPSHTICLAEMFGAYDRLIVAELAQLPKIVIVYEGTGYTFHQ